MFGCSSDDETSPTEEVRTPLNVNIVDVANAGDGSDIEITFILNRLENIAEVRLFLVKAVDAGSFTRDMAEQVNSANYAVNVSLTRTFRLSSDARDIDGDLIVPGVKYVAFGLSVATAESGLLNSLSLPSPESELLEQNAVSSLTAFIQAGTGGMDVDAQGNIYMGDFGLTLDGGGENVYKITPNGEVSIFASGMNGASGNDFDSDGNLYQSSIIGGYISKITPDGESAIITEGLEAPVGLSVQEDGSIYVGECFGRIKKIAPDGTVSLISDSPLLACANGVDLDANGNIYVANFNDANVIKITPEGVATIFATLPGNNNGHLLYREGLLYVAARSAHQIYTIDLSGNINLLAGTGTRQIVNGPIEVAEFSFPNDLAFSPDGTKLYINDTDPNVQGLNISPTVIRVIDLVN